MGTPERPERGGCSAMSLLALLFLGSLAGFVQGSQPAGSLNVSSLTINAGDEEESRIVLGNTADAFGIALKSNGDFEIRSGDTPSIAVTAEGDLKAGDADTWSNNTVTTCGNPGKKLLGGYGAFAGGETSKTYFELPTHYQIRVKANYHFIDAWGGETGYAKLDHRILRTDNLDQQASKVGIQLCGASIPESKFAVPIDVVIPHDAETLTLAFGSTLSRPATEQSWAVSDIQVYVR